MATEQSSHSNEPARPWSEFQNTQMYAEIDKILESLEPSKSTIIKVDDSERTSGVSSASEPITLTQLRHAYTVKQDLDFILASDQKTTKFGAGFLRRFRNGSTALGFFLGAGGYILFGEHVPIPHNFFYQAGLFGVMSGGTALSMGVGAESLTEILKRIDRKVSSINHARLPDLLDS